MSDNQSSSEIKLKVGHWYVAEVELYANNVRHRAIVSRIKPDTGNHHTIELIGRYDQPIKVRTRDLHHFKVISEITEMREE